ncbi:macrolide family glycosyltransferase [Streptomyces cyanogenus]|uniref:Oleandomycin glycosyltransferase n=1 Tax=Streptomyces cyanogenus TaxID=80860 RepID=A0ABX7U4Z8_STRCY|nr:macrolide family glycosyltransferase [Streptomyces cyanogenus]QTE03024.1 Oleandomycin glycosyltransferase [Streptomyces cyanogenus]
MPGPAEAGAGRHVAVFTAAAYSHISPLLGTVRELVRRGVRVSYATTQQFAPLVEATGATAVVFRSSLPSDPGAWPTDTRRLPLLYLDDARAMLPQLDASFAGDRPDLVLTEDPAGAGSVLAAKWRVPSVQVWTYLAAARHWSLIEPGTAGANPMAAEFLSQLGSFLAQEGVTTAARDHLTSGLAGGLVLVPRSFQPDGDTFGEEYTFAGPAPAPEPDPAQWTPPDGGDPVVLVSLGSIDHDHPEFFGTVAEAFDGLAWHVVMAIGDRCEPSDLPPLPPNVEAHRWVPNTAVLRHASLVIHHGGMATTMEALHHGVPSLVVPRLPEQAGNARRVRELGLGTAIPFRSVTAAALRRTALGLHTHAGVRRRVNLMREEIRRSGGAVTAADAVLRRLASG